MAGVAGGVGATTIATALSAIDRGLFVGRAVDVLACRATGDSLVRTGRAAQLVTQASGRRPVLAVTAADAHGPTRPVTARLRLLEPHTTAVVVLPYVRRWHELTTPLDEVRALLADHPAGLPRRLRGFTDACASYTPPSARSPAPGLRSCTRRQARSVSKDRTSDLSGAGYPIGTFALVRT